MFENRAKPRCYPVSRGKTAKQYTAARRHVQLLRLLGVNGREPVGNEGKLAGIGADQLAGVERLSSSCRLVKLRTQGPDCFNLAGKRLMVSRADSLLGKLP